MGLSVVSLRILNDSSSHLVQSQTISPNTIRPLPTRKLHPAPYDSQERYPGLRTALPHSLHSHFVNKPSLLLAARETWASHSHNSSPQLPPSPRPTFHLRLTKSSSSPVEPPASVTSSHESFTMPEALSISLDAPKAMPSPVSKNANPPHLHPLLLHRPVHSPSYILISPTLEPSSHSSQPSKPSNAISTSYSTTPVYPYLLKAASQSRGSSSSSLPIASVPTS